MDAYNADPRGLRKRKKGMQKLLQDYPLPVLGVAAFLAVCIMVALHGRAVHWQKQAKEHEGHHHRYKASHSSLATALQAKHRELEDVTRQHMTKEQLLIDLEQRSEAERRNLASHENELAGVRLELTNLQKEGMLCKQDLDNCLDHAHTNGDTASQMERQVTELQHRISAHETRELQLLTAKQELEQTVERLKVQAEQKGVHLSAPAAGGRPPGFADGVGGARGQRAGIAHSGGLPGLAGGVAAHVGSLPVQPVPAAPKVDGIQQAASLGLQPAAAVPQAPVVVEHLDLPKPGQPEGQHQKAVPSAPNL